MVLFGISKIFLFQPTLLLSRSNLYFVNINTHKFLFLLTELSPVGGLLERGAQGGPGTSSVSANSQKDPYALNLPTLYYKEGDQFKTVIWGKTTLKYRGDHDSWIVGRYGGKSIYATPLYENLPPNEKTVIMQAHVKNPTGITRVSVEYLYRIGVREPGYVSPKIKPYPSHLVFSS